MTTTTQTTTKTKSDLYGLYPDRDVVVSEAGEERLQELRGHEVEGVESPQGIQPDCLTAVGQPPL